MRILITGSTGLIGSHLIKTASPDVKLFATYNINRLVPDYPVEYIPLDIRNKKEVFACVSAIKPDVVIHTAAKGSPDWCEKNPKEAYRVNVKGTQNIADACKQFGVSLIFFSSNANYDGKNPPYSEESIASPQSVYGKNKVEAENYILSRDIKHLILRTMCVYGSTNPYGRMTFLSVLLDKLMRGQEILITNDLVVNFIYVDDVCKTVWDFVKRGINKDIYHIAGEEEITHWQFANLAELTLHLNEKLMKSVSNSELEGFINRPKNTCFDCSLAKKDFGFDPLSVYEGIIRFKKDKFVNWKFI